MSRFHSYLNSAVSILSQYPGEEPFASFLKKFFAANRKYGSGDRKQVAHACYSYFRLGKAVQDLPVEERILLGLFLCSASPNAMLRALKPDWDVATGWPLEKKIALSGYDIHAGTIFPWIDLLSAGIDAAAFAFAHIQQPDLFLRIRPGHQQQVEQKLRQAAIPFDVLPDAAIALPNAVSVEPVIALNREAVVQDLSSQQTGILLNEELRRENALDIRKVWDCCAASGGKSIMLWDMLAHLELTVSDIRGSIIANLRKRFEAAGIAPYQAVVADIAGGATPIPGEPFDLLLADVPCSGSGTWSRTPEQLFYFDEAKIAGYARLQQRVLQQAIQKLKPGGWLFYITCSVFAAENEEAVAYILSQDFTLVRSEVISGYTQRADTMFAALLRKK